MVYDPTKDDYGYDEELTLEENRENLRARSKYLYKWASDNALSCHAAGAEARAQYLESCEDYDDESMKCIEENDGWAWVEGHLEDYAMVDTMNAWVEQGTIYAKSSYGWMLDAVGYDIPGCMDYVRTWCDQNDWYHNMDALKAVLAKDWYDMWEED